MIEFDLKYENENKTVEQRKLVFKGLGFYVETEEGLKNPFIAIPSDVVYDATEKLLETGLKHIVKRTETGRKYEVTQL